VRRIDLLTVGEAFQDLIFVGLPHLPRDGEELRTSRFVSTIGGGAVITATAASRLGVATAIASALSDEAMRALGRDKVRVFNLKRRSEAHAVTASLSTTTDRSFVTFDGVNQQLEARLPPVIARHPARHVHLAFAPRECARWTRIAERLRKSGVTTSWDFGWSPVLPSRRGFETLLGTADFIFVNEKEAALYARAAGADAVTRFWRTRSRNTIVKVGPRGSRWMYGCADDSTRQGRDLSAPAPRVRAIDTTGAGDAFNGGFLFAWLGGASPRECLRIGNLIGAQSTLAAGGVDALPTRAQLSTEPTEPTRPIRGTQPTRPTRPL
jgi:sugar/nucleoside kinase (ribokinase family)